MTARAYYNEFDPGAAAWLRNLISMGLIADGDVDERSILDVRPDDLRGYTQCHFFAGIGGWSEALRLAGWGDTSPVWTGSPPCQPFSVAGKGLSRDDPRHLAPHFVSLVRACRPAVLFGEQVASSDVFGKAPKRAGKGAAIAPDWAWLDDLSDRLEAAHYAVGASDIPAAGIHAPNIRQRTFFGALDGLADAHCGIGRQGREIGRRGDQGGDADAWPGSGGNVIARRLADTDDTGLEGRGGMLGGRGERASGQGGLAGGLGNASGIGPGSRRNGDHGGNDREQFAAAREGDRMAHTSGATSKRDARGLSGEEAQINRARQFDGREPDGYRDGRAACGSSSGSPLESFWRDPDWLFCRDALWRPVEPGTFPLAHGLPAGMGVLSPEDRRLAGLAGLSQQSLKAAKQYRKEALRGYGNAINPHAAAEFIRAFDAVLSARAHLETAA